MRYIFTACLLTAVVAGYAGNETGHFLESRQRQPTEISNGCAYYDMDSGRFTWGARPVIVEKTNVDVNPLSEMPIIDGQLRPGRKPHQ